MKLLERVLREHLRPGDLVGVEDPSFPGLLDLLSSAGYGRVPIALDTEKHTVTVHGAAVGLTAKEFLLLDYLIKHRGKVLSRDALLTDVWGYRYTGGTRTVDVHVRRLREKLPWLTSALVTVKQFGYKLTDPPPR